MKPNNQAIRTAGNLCHLSCPPRAASGYFRYESPRDVHSTITTIRVPRLVLVAEHARLSIDVDGWFHDSPRFLGLLLGYGKLLLP